MEMATYAVVEDSRVTNLVTWDGKAKWKPNVGSELVKVNLPVGIGWAYNNGKFAPPTVEENSNDT